MCVCVSLLYVCVYTCVDGSIVDIIHILEEFNSHLSVLQLSLKWLYMSGYVKIVKYNFNLLLYSENIVIYTFSHMAFLSNS